MDSESLEDLNVKFDELRSSIENLERELQSLKAWAAQLAGLYVIFQGIMYVQAIIPSAALIGTRWIAAGLSGFVSVSFWLTLIPTVNDLFRYREQQDLTFLEQQRTYRKIFSIQNGRKLNSGSTAAQQRLAKAFATARHQRYAYVWAVLSALFSFTMLVSYALVSIPRF
ncbi:hypothetical protein Salat_0729400 [Sesamum alatum]|uniref:Uncharacterized protein n=1 Tax=Sesamum alatum TaxID=300844 RepID=A0AAE1YSG9_9LAMI|nr:hypothetical protein Salat_0729400 [Sesamum alatum]